MALVLSVGGTVAVAAGGLLTALAVVRLVVLGGDGDGSGRDGADGPTTERLDRIVAALALAGLGVALIVVGLVWG